MTQRTLVILGHPSRTSFCGALADTYLHAAKNAGHEVRVLSLGEMAFDPVLHHGYTHIQALEPDLLHAQSDMLWATHLVFVFPVWWGGIPALMKGFIDRTFLPGFAFKYRVGKLFPDKLLHGRTAHLLVTLDTPPWYYRWIYRMPAIHQIRIMTLAFCGITPTKTLMFGPVLGSKPKQREKWLTQTAALLEKRNFHVHRQSRAVVGHDHQGDSAL
ncbi:NAD(P)H-dependent oxidoreductase [Pseudomonas graminis]